MVVQDLAFEDLILQVLDPRLMIIEIFLKGFLPCVHLVLDLKHVIKHPF